MNYRQMIINCAAFGIVGFILGSNGMGFLTWQFWTIVALMVTIQVNSMIE